ncbi:nucleotidyltransferase domain-containing protein [Candidatus Peregrinibacteria bacterium]|nr:nucleotidyltransferase domain-containing protein [Candidatus Peregrinibacteria bacterium]
MGIQDIKIRVIPILKAAGVTKSELFGSMARGDNHSGSDCDLLVEMPQDTSLFEFADLKNKLEDSLSMRVDLVSYDSLNKKIKPFVKKDSVKIL